MSKRLVEKRRRGIVGWFFLAIFWIWNALMVAWLVASLRAPIAEYDTLATQAERDGTAAGIGVAFVIILMVWALGGVVFGLLAYFTRGRRELIEMEA
ncbi:MULTISPECIES: hypothetical protein [Filomicrobium]|nr:MULTISPECIES: hypothetical protein [Filomicrobium]MCV0371088.1 hypothetical protein [Filomicrobium sp.]